MKTPELDKIEKLGEAPRHVAAFLKANLDLLAVDATTEAIMAAHFGIDVVQAGAERGFIVQAYVDSHRACGNNPIPVGEWVDSLYGSKPWGRATIPFLGPIQIPAEEVELDAGDDAILDAIHDGRQV